MSSACQHCLQEDSKKLITTKNDKACCLHMNTIQSISNRAHQEGLTSHQQVGALQDLSNINSGIEQDHITSTLKGNPADKKVSTFKFALVENNSTGGNMFGKNKRF